MNGSAHAGRAVASSAGAGPNLLVINGPNINLLGLREPDIYGEENYDALLSLVEQTAREHGFRATCYQSNHEGDLVDAIQQAYFDHVDGIIINLPAYLAGLGEDAYLTEFIPSPDAEIVEEDTPSGDDFGMDDMTMDEVPAG